MTNQQLRAKVAAMGCPRCGEYRERKIERERVNGKETGWLICSKCNKAYKAVTT